MHSDYGLYFNGVVLIAAYIDDMAIARLKDLKAINKAKEMLKSEFDIKDLGECRQLLGMEVTQGPGIITIRQQGYIEDTLCEFGPEDCKTVSMPMEPGRKLVPATDDDPRCDREQYQQLNGKLMWTMIATQLDLAFTIGRLSQFNNDPTETHWIARKQVLCYLKGTKDAALHYCSKSDNSGLTGYSDRDYAEDITQKSTSGQIFMLAGGAIAWASRKQSLVASSTTEAEYIAYSDAAKEVAWLQQLCLDAKCEDQLLENGSVLLHGDNQACLTIAKDPEHHSRMKAIDVQYHHMRDLIARGIIILEYVPTEHMLADGLTKPLQRGHLKAHKRAYGLY